MEEQWETVNMPSRARLGRVLVLSQGVCVLFGQDLEGSQSFWVGKEHNYGSALRRLSGQQGAEHIIWGEFGSRKIS